MTDFLDPVPDDRTVVPGFWSDLMDRFHNAFVFVNGFFHLRTNSIPKDFLVEVAKGNVPGHSLYAHQMAGEIDTTLGEVWGGTGDMTYPDINTPETWEVVSSGNDTNGGTGAWSGVVISLDASGDEQVNTFTLNGGTATLGGTHIRPREIFVDLAGSSGWNENQITLQKAGGGAGSERNIIKPAETRSYDGHYTIPFTKRAIFLSSINLLGKDTTGNAFTSFRDANTANAAWNRNANFPFYQNEIILEIFAKFPIPGGFDLRLLAQTDTGVSNITTIYEFLIVDADLIGLNATSLEMHMKGM